MEPRFTASTSIGVIIEILSGPPLIGDLIFYVKGDKFKTLNGAWVYPLIQDNIDYLESDRQLQLK